MFRLPFLEDTSPPPFYQPHLSAKARTKLDEWFIGQRSQRYYLKRFKAFDEKGKLYATWNWSAFVATFGWLLYRKRYLDCLVYCIAGWSFIKLNIVIILAVCEFLFVGDLAHHLKMPVRVMIGASVWLFWAGMVARWADAYYYRMARREIADALELYPFDKEAQRRHLAQHGQTSLVGLSCAFGVFLSILAIIALQFVPLIAKQKEQATINDSYQQARAVQRQVQGIYEATNQCPIGLPVGADRQTVSLEVVGQLAHQNTDCAVVATITGATYPVRYLNKNTLILYRTKDTAGNVVWRCQTSLTKAQAPKRCV